MDISLLLISREQNKPLNENSSVPTPTSVTTSFIHSSVATQHGQPAHPAVKKQSKWSATEDALIIELRGSGTKWEEISNRLPGRSATSCRLHYQNYLERKAKWDEAKKNKLAMLYKRHVINPMQAVMNQN